MELPQGAGQQVVVSTAPAPASDSDSDSDSDSVSGAATHAVVSLRHRRRRHQLPVEGIPRLLLHEDVLMWELVLRMVLLPELSVLVVVRALTEMYSQQSRRRTMKLGRRPRISERCARAPLLPAVVILQGKRLLIRRRQGDLGRTEVVHERPVYVMVSSSSSSPCPFVLPAFLFPKDERLLELLELLLCRRVDPVLVGQGEVHAGDVEAVGRAGICGRHVLLDPLDEALDPRCLPGLVLVRAPVAPADQPDDGGPLPTLGVLLVKVVRAPAVPLTGVLIAHAHTFFSYVHSSS